MNKPKLEDYNRPIRYAEALEKYIAFIQRDHNSMIRAHQAKIEECKELAEDIRKMKVSMASDLAKNAELLAGYSFYDEELTKINWVK